MQSDNENVKQGTRRVSLIIPLLITLCLMAVMVIYTSNVINRISVANIQEAGADKLSGITARLENYLDTTKNALWVTADTVDHMVRNGGTTDQILLYIVDETEQQKIVVNENFTGIYGYIKGEYLDGLNWEPPEDYNPLQRDWYIAAQEAHGETAVIPPYVDAQTGSMVISISRQLSNPEDVLSVDVMMDRIQDMVQELKIKGKGFGFIVDGNGMIIAHPEEARKGSYLTNTEEKRQFMSKIREIKNGNFEMEIDGKLRTIFIRQIEEMWFVVIAVTNEELYAETWLQLTVNVLICLIIFALIALFYYVGRRNEQNFSRRMEEMKIEEQKQAYETRVLKLEKEAADRANKAKSDFLADMSHEIRTPINAVLGMNEMILRESSDAREEPSADRKGDALNNIRNYAGNIEKAGNNLLSIINDILDFSKIEAGKTEISEGRYELSSLISDVCNMISFRAKEKGLEFITEVDEKMPDGLYGDKVRVRQIITNLLTNAVKYTDRGSVRLNIYPAEKVFHEGETITLQISVEDTGIGIREEDLGKLFDKFQRVDLDRNSTVEGAGLGLAITSSLLSLMNGKINVESVYGKGSRFTVSLPQKVVSCEPIGGISMKEEPDGSGAGVYQELFRAPEAKILIVDDTRINLAVTTGLLKKTEVRTDTAQSGREALEMAEKTAYDLILMDQRMPGMDGTEVLRALREKKDGLNFRTPVICMTADAIIGAKERYTAEGFTDYLPKPVSGDVLEKKLIRYLPKEKITFFRQNPEQQDSALNGREEQEDRTDLLSAGISMKEGLSNCGGDEELYQSILREYAAGAEEKQLNIQDCFREKNWKQYGILVHALKSSSRLIGASSLSEEAAALEKAADEGRTEAITRNHGPVMEHYLQTARTAAEYIGAAENEKETDDSVLEFFPD